MPASLADFRTLMLAHLGAAPAGRYDTATLDSALRLALKEYSQAAPNLETAVLTFASAGREISLASLSGFFFVLEINFPYTPDDASPVPYPAYYVFTAAGTPTLRITGGRVPAAGEKARVVYAARHTVKDLDSAAATTIPADHESRLALGAAGFAALTRAASLTETFGVRGAEFKNLLTWSSAALETFRSWLRSLNYALSGYPACASAWRLDNKDTRPLRDASFYRDWSG